MTEFGASPSAENVPAAADSLLEPARQALECGDYGRCLRLLETLAADHPAATALGGRLRLLQATAQMGQGNTQAAAATCRSLRQCRDATLRAMAKDLEEVLAAPALERPREWSISLPSLGEMQSLGSDVQALASRRRRQRPSAPPPPPTGPTSAPWGFALVAIALLLLTVLLGGCVQVDTTLHLAGPGRVQVLQTSQSSTDHALPWQRHLAASQRDSGLQAQLRHGRLAWRSQVLPAEQALALLQNSLEQSAESAGLTLPSPHLKLKERNWLLGVRQQLDVQVDLTALEPLPGLGLRLIVEPLALRAVQAADPSPAQAAGAGVRWSLQPGAINSFSARCWRWSRLGLGSLVILLLLAVVLLLQRLRVWAGYGLPELPA